MTPETNTGHPRRWLILSVLVVSLLVVVLDNTILNVAMKTIADPVAGLGASQSELEWAINSYTLVFAGLLFTLGVVGDRIGRRLMLLVGLVVFGIASLASAYAQDPGQLIAARALMGVGGAAILPATLSIISNVFDPRERGKAIGVWAGSVGLAVAIGPIVGGFLIEHFWWGSVFFINVPIVALGIAAVLAIVPESKDPHPGRIDPVGVTLSVVGLATFVFGVIRGGQIGDWSRLDVWGPVLAGVAILAAFVWYERRIDHPALDVRLFTNPRFTVAVVSMAMMFFAAFGVFFFSTFYLQLVRDYSALEAGFLMVPFAVAQLIFAPLSATLVKRFGPKVVCSVGMGLGVFGMGGFVFIATDTPIYVLELMFFIQGVGMAMAMPAVTESVMSSLPREKAGVGSAVANTFRQVGGALGVAVLGSLLASVYRGGITPSLAAVPAGDRHEAGESIAMTYDEARKLFAGGQVREAGALVAKANDVFVDAMHWVAIGSVLVSVVGVIIVATWLPWRSATIEPPGAGGGDAPPPGKTEFAEVSA